MTFYWLPLRNDADNNGLINGGETGIGGVTLTLTGNDDAGNPVTRSTTTGWP